MTDKVQKIRKEVERLKEWNNNVRNSTRHMTLQEEDFNRGKHSSYLEILDFIDTLQDEPVSEELEEAAKRYATEGDEISGLHIIDEEVEAFKAGAKWQKEQCEKNRLKHCDELTSEQAQIESDFITQHLKKNNRTPTFIDAIEYGMKKQKKQMMAKAVEWLEDNLYEYIIDNSHCGGKGAFLIKQKLYKDFKEYIEK